MRCEPFVVYIGAVKLSLQAMANLVSVPGVNGIRPSERLSAHTAGKHPVRYALEKAARPPALDAHVVEGMPAACSRGTVFFWVALFIADCAFEHLIVSAVALELLLWPWRKAE